MVGASYHNLRSRGSVSCLLRPYRALVAGLHHADALVDELLDAFALKGFGRVDVALGVGGDRVHAEKLAGLAPTAAEGGEFLHAGALNDAHALVLAVGQIDEALRGIAREGDLPGRACGERIFREEVLAHELAVGVEDLDAVVLAIADIEQAVIGERNA